MTERSPHNSPLLVPAARWDALSMLAAGLLMPAHGLPQPTGRLACAAPGLLPLTRGPVPESWLAATPEEDEATPVLFELGMEPDAAPPLSTDDLGLMVVPAVVPLSCVSCLHFRSEREADEFRARRFDTVRPEDANFKVSPDLFKATGPDAHAALAWLEAVRSPGVQGPQIADADALAGAFILAATLETTSAPELEVRQHVLSALLAPSAKEQGLEVLVAALTQDAWVGRPADLDRRLLSTSLRVLTSSSTEAKVGSRRLIETIRRTVQDDHNAPEIDKSLQAIAAILQGKLGLPEPRPDHGLRSAKALLLLLLRPEPSDTLTWIRERPADALAVLGAVLMAGYLTGARSLPLDVKTGPATDPARRVAADRVNSSHDQPFGPFASNADRDVVMQVTEGAETSDGVRLLLGGSTLAEIKVSPGRTPAAAEHAQLDLDAGDTPSDDEGFDEPRADLLTNVLALVESAASDGRSDLARNCAAACENIGWQDLTSTAVAFDKGSVIIEAGVARFQGSPPISYEFELPAIRERLNDLNTEDVTKFAEIVSAASRKPKPAKRRRAPARTRRPRKKEPPLEGGPE